MASESIPFVARLRAKGIDPPMLLFAMRRIGVTANVAPPTRGATDLEVTGTAQDMDVLVAGLGPMTGAVHYGDVHVALKEGKATKHDDAAAAEAHLGGPFTIAGFPRAAWAHGGPPADHVVQVLYFSDTHIDMPSLAKATSTNLEAIAACLKQLAATQTVRKFRQEGEAWKDGYGLARAARERIDAMRKPAPS